MSYYWFQTPKRGNKVWLTVGVKPHKDAVKYDLLLVSNPKKTRNSMAYYWCQTLRRGGKIWLTVGVKPQEDAEKYGLLLVSNP